MPAARGIGMSVGPTLFFFFLFYILTSSFCACVFFSVRQRRRRAGSDFIPVTASNLHMSIYPPCPGSRVYIFIIIIVFIIIVCAYTTQLC